MQKTNASSCHNSASLFISTALATNNYKEKAIYLGIHEGICNYGGGSADQINLIISV